MSMLSPPEVLGPEANGVLLTPEEFDNAEFEEGWRYELINGVLIVSPAPLERERDPNEELGRWLRNYQEDHPDGKALDVTLAEHTVYTGRNRRRVDRVLWIGLGRLPTRNDAPTVAVEFVSAGKRSFVRDYEEKRAEYRSIGVREYWIIDRFARTMTVFSLSKRGRGAKQIVTEDDTYTTPLLRGFELPLGRLLEFADRWER